VRDRLRASRARRNGMLRFQSDATPEPSDVTSSPHSHKVSRSPRDWCGDAGAAFHDRVSTVGLRTAARACSHKLTATRCAIGGRALRVLAFAQTRARVRCALACWSERYSRVGIPSADRPCVRPHRLLEAANLSNLTARQSSLPCDSEVTNSLLTVASSTLRRDS
jgi:hypothetical protein